MAQSLLALVASVIDGGEHGITEESTSATIPAWDSLAELMLASTLEYEYGVTLSLSDLERLHSVREIREILETHGVTLHE